MKISELLETDVLSLGEHLTIEEAVCLIREKISDGRVPGYVYVTDAKGCLSGVVQMRDLLIHPPAETVRSIMKKDVAVLLDEMPSREMVEIFQKHRFMSLPVIDGTRKLLGVIPAAKVRSFHAFLKKPFQKAAEELSHRSIVKMMVLRSPWLLLSILTGVAAAFVLGNFFPGIETFITLILFIPILLGLSGSVARQAAVMMNEQILEGSIRIRATFHILAKEISLAFLSGGLILGVVAVMALALAKSLWIPVAIGSGIASGILLAGWLGVLLPVILSAVRVDPKIAASSFGVILCDLFALWFYFQVSFFFLTRYFEGG